LAGFYLGPHKVAEAVKGFQSYPQGPHIAHAAVDRNTKPAEVNRRAFFIMDLYMSEAMELIYAPEGEYQGDPLRDEPLKRRGRTLAVGLLLLAMIGGGSAYLWYYYGGPIIGPAASKPDQMSQLTITVQGLQQSRQDIAADVRRNQEMLQAQQADIKRLSERFAQLAAKLDLLQSNAREAEAAAPPAHKLPPKKPASKPLVHETASQAPASSTPEERQ
jgi:hypothetical protein